MKPDFLSYQSSAIAIGSLMMGGKHPLVLQSMTNTPTSDVSATVQQCIRLFDAGAQLVRITAQTIAEARLLGQIRKELNAQGYHGPLCADVHFNPQIAEIAAALVEKVRINPGNFVDLFPAKKVYSDEEYQQELEATAIALQHLAKICLDNNTCLRLGINHGSLPRRVMHRYGDTVEGMTTAAMEYLKILSDLGLSKIVVSMKASHVGQMLRSTRLLADKMMQAGYHFPLHLGVTEAGEGEDGRIKSAIGIGALLLDGLGDTIRVSLTEDPVAEIPVAKSIVQAVQQLKGDQQASEAYFQLVGAFDYRPHAAKDALFQKPLVLGPPPADMEHIPTGTPYTRIDTNSSHHALRQAMVDALKQHADRPLLLHARLQQPQLLDERLRHAIQLGAVLIDGLGDGLHIQTDAAADEPAAVQLAFDILQATRRRVSRTEYVSCPSCGRTLFDIQGVLRQVKARTAHFSGITIAVMGCIVNGPGEMAGADFGYVGSGNNSVTLYHQGKAIKRNIPAEGAVDELLQLIATYHPEGGQGA